MDKSGENYTRAERHT